MYLFAEFIPDAGHLTLSGEEAHHMLHVLRMKQGDPVFLLDGKGRKASAHLLDVLKKEAILQIDEVQQQQTENPATLSLAVCPTKNADRMEWLVEKAVEAGVGELYFIESARTERGKINVERLRKIAHAALKQSGRLWLPQLHGLISFKEHLQRLPEGMNQWIAYCLEGEKTTIAEARKQGGKHHILIGPEGDFNPDEIKFALEKGFRPLSLGPTRLRTETAALLVSFAFSDCLE